MFYCDPCAEARSWPAPTLFRSLGRCEICGKTAACNDCPSSQLPAEGPGSTSPEPGPRPVDIDENNRQIDEALAEIAGCTCNGQWTCCACTGCAGCSECEPAGGDQ